ncbi:MAG: hypothetical protein WCD16_00050 [Paracoccaceae bacterium]
MTNPSKPRRVNARRFVAVGAAAAMGAAPAVSIAATTTSRALRETPAHSAAAYDILRVASSEAGEGGEGADVSAPPASEGGEGGESGGYAGPGGQVGGLLAELDLLEARLNLATELKAAGLDDAAAAAQDRVFETFENDVEDKLNDHMIEEIEKALFHMGGAIEGGGDLSAARNAVQHELDEVREDANAGLPERFGAVARLVRNATGQYAASIEDGRIAELDHYRDARALLALARARTGTLAATGDAEAANIAAEITAQLDLMEPAVADLTPNPEAAVDTSILYGAAARVEISAQKLR